MNRAHLAFTRVATRCTSQFRTAIDSYRPFLTDIPRYMALSVTTQLLYGNLLQHIEQIKETLNNKQLAQKLDRTKTRKHKKHLKRFSIKDVVYFCEILYKGSQRFDS